MTAPNAEPGSRFTFSEDWLAVLIAFFIILLSIVGLIGQNGIKIVF